MKLYRLLFLAILSPVLTLIAYREHLGFPARLALPTAATAFGFQDLTWGTQLYMTHFFWEFSFVLGSFIFAKAYFKSGTGFVCFLLLSWCGGYWFREPTGFVYLSTITWFSGFVTAAIRTSQLSKRLILFAGAMLLPLIVNLSGLWVLPDSWRSGLLSPLGINYLGTLVLPLSLFSLLKRPSFTLLALASLFLPVPLATLVCFFLAATGIESLEKAIATEGIHKNFAPLVSCLVLGILVFASGVESAGEYGIVLIQAVFMIFSVLFAIRARVYEDFAKSIVFVFLLMLGTETLSLRAHIMHREYDELEEVEWRSGEQSEDSSSKATHSSRRIVRR